MLPTAIALGALGGVAKFYSETLRGDAQALDKAVPLADLPDIHAALGSSGQIYGHFRGSLHSNKENVIKDSESGLEFGVVAMRKTLVEIVEFGRGTSRIRTETILTDSGNQFFGDISLKGEAKSKKMNFKDDGIRHVECVLSEEACGALPIPLVFSNYHAAQGGVVINNNISTTTRRRGHGVEETSSVSVPSRSVVGTRVDISAAKSGANVTFIGKFTGDAKKGNWVAISGVATAKTFDDYRAGLNSSSYNMNILGNVLLGLGVGCGAWYGVSAYREQPSK
jgi:hypothetical protein